MKEKIKKLQIIFKIIGEKIFIINKHESVQIKLISNERGELTMDLSIIHNIVGTEC